jgi:hypothetical protein
MAQIETKSNCTVSKFVRKVLAGTEVVRDTRLRSDRNEIVLCYVEAEVKGATVWAARAREFKLDSKSGKERELFKY